MVLQLVAMLRDDLSLAALDFFIDELNYFTAVNTDHVIVMMVASDFEYSVAAIEIMSLHNASRFELREHSINGGETDVFACVD